MTPCFLVECHQRLGGENSFFTNIGFHLFEFNLHTPTCGTQPTISLFFTRAEVQTVKFHIGQNFIQTRRKFRMYFQRLTSIRIRVHSCSSPPQITECRAICIT